MKRLIILSVTVTFTHSLFGIINGKETTEYLSSYQLSNGGICTGTAISPTTLVTAAHCIKSRKDNAVKVVLHDGKKVDSIKIYVDEDAPIGASSSSDETATLDLVIALFPEKTFGTDFRPLAPRATPSGKKVHLVGFGRGSPDDDGSDPKSPFRAGIKRFGSNHISLWKANGGLYEVVGIVSSEKENNAVPTYGDSGGPLYNSQDEVIGVCSGYYFGDQAAISSYVSLHSEKSEKLFELAREERPGDFIQDSQGNIIKGAPKPSPRSGGDQIKDRNTAHYEFGDGWRIELVKGKKGRLRDALKACNDQGALLLRSGYFNRHILTQLGLVPEKDRVYYYRGHEPTFRLDPYAIIWYPKDEREAKILSVDKFYDGEFEDGHIVCQRKSDED